MATTKITNPDLFDLGSLNTALKLPSGTTAERPTSPSTGEWRYNTTTNLVEFWDGGEWRDLQSEDLPPVPSENFNTVLYTGNGSTQSITGVGFQPDFVWIKRRDANNYSHRVFDTTRGATKLIRTNETTAEQTDATSLTSFDADGFTVGSNTYVNINGGDFVAWCWKGGGSGNTFNIDGTGYSTASAAGLDGGNINPTGASINRRAGFGIYTASPTTATQSISHGLNSTPDMYIFKTTNIARDWYVSFKDGATWKFGVLNSTAALGTTTAYTANSSTMVIGGGSSVNEVVYAFHSVEGFSKIGTYTGNGSTNGPIIETGFEPAFLLVKQTDAVSNWVIVDNKRSTTNQRDIGLRPNTSESESTVSNNLVVNFLTNGFQLKQTSGSNANGGNFIYMAFAADPSPAPTLANSFYETSYTGNNTNPRSFTGFGFQPMFSWIKSTNQNRDHIFTTWAMLSSYNRTGANDLARTNATSITSTTAQIQSYDPDGVTMGNYTDVNYTSNYSYIGWFWKGSTLPTINNDGSKQTVISLNKAAGMSVIHYSGSTGGATLGHGLDQTPEFIYYWPYSLTNSKQVKSESIGFDTFRLFTNTDGAQSATSDFPSLPTSSVITVSGGLGTNYAGQYYNMIVFHSVDGFSKFGSYTGTGAAGNTVNIGFQPTFVMLKSISVVGDWVIIDSSYADSYLAANTSNDFNTLDIIDFNSTGFELKGTSENALNETYQFVCFKVN